ncbi:hypothetical protein DN748_18810 [Sinomicrobium soli]|nr:hypothetical protein DN748_18810 [Sinomicrobium sp. N-1-3-6]
MNNLIKGIVVLLFIVNLLHLTLLLFMPIGGAIVFVKGIFFAVLENNKDILGIDTVGINIINLVSSILYIGSIVSGIIIPLIPKIPLHKRLITEIFLSLIPFILIALRFLFFP